MRDWLYRPLKHFIFLHLVSILFFAGEVLFSRGTFRFTDRLIIDEDRTLLNIFEYLPRLLPHIIEEFRMFVQSDLWRISCPSWKPFRPVQRQSRSRWFYQIDPPRYYPQLIKIARIIAWVISFVISEKKLVLNEGISQFEPRRSRIISPLRLGVYHQNERFVIFRDISQFNTPHISLYYIHILNLVKYILIKKRSSI